MSWRQAAGGGGRVSGKVLMSGLVAVAALMGGGLWYASEYAYVHEVDGLSSIVVDHVAVAVSAYRGLDGNSSPLKLRGCFRVDPQALADAPSAENPAPLIAPVWFGCFDAEAIGADLEAGRARAVMAGLDPEGFRRVIAVYPDGRAFLWREVVE